MKGPGLRIKLENRNQRDILMTVIADVIKGKTDMSCKGQLQTLAKLSMRHQVCPGETCRTTISESIITMLMSRGRSNCRLPILRSKSVHLVMID